MTSHEQDSASSDTRNTSVGRDTPVVDIRNLVHQRGNHTLIDGVSLRVAHGEYIALMGPNGSGKTTLARHLNAMLQPTSGDVHVLGKRTTNPSNTDAIRRAVGLVFQDPDDQMVAVTVEDEIAFGLENRAVPRDEMLRRVDDTIRRFHLDHVRDRATTSLSGGEQQRVAIAAVWATEPTLLVLDEPTSMLDRPSATALLRFLDNLITQHPDRAVIHITQSVTEAQHAHRVVIMERGRIVLDGPPAEALTDTDRLREIGIARRTHPWKRERQCADPIIEAVDVGHTRRDGPLERTVLTGVNAEIARGRVTAIIGRSGSGKTTFAWHLNRLLEPSDGHINIDGRPARDIPLVDVRRKVGITFQRVDLQLFEPTVIEDVAFGLLQRGTTQSEAHVHAKEALAEVGLDPERYANRRPMSLSVGEQRRVALAGVLALGTEVLVLDEPTSGLDAHGVEQLGEQLRRLVDAGRSVVIVTHDLDFARAIADRVLVFEEGSATQSDDVNATLNQLEEAWSA